MLWFISDSAHEKCACLKLPMYEIRIMVDSSVIAVSLALEIGCKSAYLTNKKTAIAKGQCAKSRIHNHPLGVSQKVQSFNTTVQCSASLSNILQLTCVSVNNRVNCSHKIYLPLICLNEHPMLRSQGDSGSQLQWLLHKQEFVIPSSCQYGDVDFVRMTIRPLCSSYFFCWALAHQTTCSNFSINKASSMIQPLLEIWFKTITFSFSISSHEDQNWICQLLSDHMR